MHGGRSLMTSVGLNTFKFFSTVNLSCERNFSVACSQVIVTDNDDCFTGSLIKKKFFCRKKSV